MSTAPAQPLPLHSSASVYSKLALFLYDFVVLTVSNTFAWRCRTGSALLPFYQQHIGESTHLEVGVGTGYYLAASVAQLSKLKLVTLLDLNPNTLVVGKRRLENAGYTGEVELVERSIFDPLPGPMHGRYDSVALYYLFHCLPGAFPSKAQEVFATVSPALAPGGSCTGQLYSLMDLYNRKGIFGNYEDSEDRLRQALEAAFEDSELRVIGVVALFSGRRPRMAGNA
ncbi:S-adenosyl-L-methionine dependent methyltransferase [Trametes elegans]|nr:S-adenosyl-L-methionine dependent methyltransferase [Trametes elegans]